jgi:hypothetical protein
MPLNSGLKDDVEKLSDVLFNVDTMINTNKKADAPSFSPTEDPMPPLRLRNMEECMVVKQPKYLRARTKDEVVSCGWYYMEDQSKRSFAVLGTSKEPILPEFVKGNPGGQWIWDSEKAQKLEDAKKCAQITSCETSDIYANECAFCPSISKGIPIENGKTKYKDDPNLTCNVRFITDPAQCPEPEPVSQTIITDTGEIKKSGELYLGEVIPFKKAQGGLCDANPDTGKISEKCLISIARAIGFSRTGILIKILEGDREGYYNKLGANFDKFRTVRKLFENDEKFKLKGQYFGDGPITRAEILNAYRYIYKMMTSSKSKRINNAAKWLVTGQTYDPCEYEPNEIGPFEPLCQQRLALDSGCQRDGYKFPGPGSYGENNLLTWSKLSTSFSELYQALNANDPAIQRKANLDCLGISIVSDAAILAGDPGTPCRILSETDIQRNLAVTLAQGASDNLKMEIDDYPMPIEKKMATLLYKESLKFKEEVISKLRKINKCPPNPPIACWDFYLGSFEDRMKKIKSTVRGTLNLETLGGKKCAYFKGSTYLDIKGPIFTKDFKSITMMVYINSLDEMSLNLSNLFWSFMNVKPKTQWCSDALYGKLDKISPGNALVTMGAKISCQGPSIKSEAPITAGKWYHLAWVIDQDYSGMTIYVNGIKNGRWSDPRGKSSLINRKFEDVWVMRTPHKYVNDSGIAWFRVFDYALNDEGINIDLKNKWVLPPL